MVPANRLAGNFRPQRVPIAAAQFDFGSDPELAWTSLSNVHVEVDCSIRVQSSPNKQLEKGRRGVSSVESQHRIFKPDQFSSDDRLLRDAEVRRELDVSRATGANSVRMRLAMASSIGNLIGAPRVLVDINELSARLSIAKGTLYNWVYQRRIPYIKAGRCLRFDPDEVLASLSQFTTMGQAGKG
jgi:excisionase family DNA binding protein